MGDSPDTHLTLAGDNIWTAPDQCALLAAHCKAVLVHLPDGVTKQISPKHFGTATFPTRTQKANK